jgi:small subunit ribosomal protein S3
VGHKVNPIGFRLGINRTWDSRWLAGADYATLLHDDLKLRDHLRTRLRGAGVSRVVIERPAKKPRVTIYAARPGVVIGKKGQDIEVLKKDLSKMAKTEVSLNIVEIRRPEIDATLVAENIAQQLERRVAFRRAMKRAVQSAMRLGAQGIRINCAGRLGGAEIARAEWYREGRVPLHTLRADIDYGIATAKTTYGTCGVKVWVFKGEILAHDPTAQDLRAVQQSLGPIAGPLGRGGEIAGVVRPAALRDLDARLPLVSPAPMVPLGSKANRRSSSAAGPRGTANVTHEPLLSISHHGRDTDIEDPSLVAAVNVLDGSIPPLVYAGETEFRSDPLTELWLRNARSELMRALGETHHTAEASCKAIASMLRLGLEILARETVDRELAKLARSIMPALFSDLFSSVVEVRWSAAFAITALRNPRLFHESKGIPECTSDLEPVVLVEIERYLADRRSSLFSYVAVNPVKDDGSEGAQLRIRICVSNTLPMLLAGRRPSVSPPKWLSQKPELHVIVMSDVGEQLVAESGGEPTDTCLVTLEVPVNVSGSDTTELIVDLHLDGRVLARHQILLDDQQAVRPGNISRKGLKSMRMCTEQATDPLLVYFLARKVNLLDNPRIEDPLGRIYAHKGGHTEVWGHESTIEGKLTLTRAEDTTTDKDQKVETLESAKMHVVASASLLDKVMGALGFGGRALDLSAALKKSGATGVTLKLIGLKVTRLRTDILADELALARFTDISRGRLAGREVYVVTGAWSAYAADIRASNDANIAVEAHAGLAEIAKGQAKLEVKNADASRVVFRAKQPLYFGVEVMRIVEEDSGLKLADRRPETRLLDNTDAEILERTILPTSDGGPFLNFIQGDL